MTDQEMAYKANFIIPEIIRRVAAGQISSERYHKALDIFLAQLNPLQLMMLDTMFSNFFNN
jgi:hypothetical protein